MDLPRTIEQDQGKPEEGTAPSPGDHPLDALDSPDDEAPVRWLINVAGEGEPVQGSDGHRVVNINDLSAYMSLRSREEIIKNIGEAGQLLVQAKADELPLRDGVGGVVSNHLPLAGEARENAVDEALRVRAPGGAWDLHFCNLGSSPADGEAQFSATVH